MQTKQPNRPQIAGDLTPEEKNVLEQMKQRAQQIVLRIGSMEVEKSRLLMGLDQQEMMIQQHLQVIGKRLNIPAGAGWQVIGDKALIINMPPGTEAPVTELKVVKDEVPEVDAPPEEPAPPAESAAPEEAPKPEE
jgi:hypothetical protein